MGRMQRQTQLFTFTYSTNSSKNNAKSSTAHSPLQGQHGKSPLPDTKPAFWGQKLSHHPMQIASTTSSLKDASATSVTIVITLLLLVIIPQTENSIVEIIQDLYMSLPLLSINYILLFQTTIAFALVVRYCAFTEIVKQKSKLMSLYLQQ